MDYLIENIVLFDSDACRLINVQTEDAFTLSLTHAQLLSLLIEYRGFAVSRNEIFEKIFDPNGAHATNNNLNQTISILRKYLSQLGIETEVITTITRVGFMIKDDVLLEPQQKNLTEPASPSNAPPVISEKSTLPLVQNTALILFALVGAGLAGWLFWSVNADRDVLVPDKLPVLASDKINDFNGCAINKLTVRGAGDDYIKDDRGFQSTLDEMHCDNAARTQFYISKNTVSHNNYRAFTLKCIRAFSGQYDCYSVYKSVEVD